METANLRKYAKRLLLATALLVVLYLVFVNGLSLHKTRERSGAAYSLTREERKELLARIEGATDEREVIERCDEFARERLSFRRHNDLKSGKANCVGYARYTAALLIAAYTHKGWTASARPVVGEVHLYGLNLHPIATALMPTDLKAFFADHDFVEVSKGDGTTLFVDTSLEDLLGKSFM